MDKISDSRCTTQKIVLPSNTTDVYNIGMSGKWLMFAIGNTVYRLDTTNVANVEVVPNVAYNNAQQFTFCVDDDVVINGWYFHNGEPSSMSKQATNTDGEVWGQHDLPVQDLRLSGILLQLLRIPLPQGALFVAPYLATINNLSSPVIKTADKTMKITYTLTETEEA